MKILHTGSLVLGLSLWLLPGTGLALQSAASSSSPVSSGLQPALDSLQQTVNGLKLEKWKGGSVRDEAAGNIQSIQKDLQTTLPPMLADADKSGGRLNALLPVSRNVDALYDVVLRVMDGARIAAPGDQANALIQGMATLEKARHALDAQIADAAAAQEKQVADLQATLKTVPPPPACPAVSEEKPAPSSAKKKAKKKPAATPAANPQPPATAKPN